VTKKLDNGPCQAQNQPLAEIKIPISCCAHLLCLSIDYQLRQESAMYARHTSRFVIVTSHLLLFAPSGTALSADYRIGLTFEQEFTAGGLRSYSVRAAFSRDDVNNKIVAPNGQVFDYRNQYAEPLTFDQFRTIAFGTWRAETASSDITFLVPALTQDNVAFKTPIITSPTPGSEVPEEFTINWLGEDRGFAEVLKRTNLAFRRSFHPAECCSTTLTYELINPGKGLLEVDVYTRTFLPAPQILQQSPFGIDTYTFEARVLSHAVRATYVVVPEPSTLLLVALTGLCFYSGRHC
jgi:hypothetical protein